MGIPTFAARVARTLTASVAAAAALTAALTIALTARAAMAREDDRLGAAYATFAHELAVEVSATHTAGDVARDEDAEVAPAGIRLALFDGPRRVGGDDRIAHAQPGCVTFTRAAQRWRQCAYGADNRRAVLVMSLEPHDRALREIALAAAAAFVAVTLGSIVAGRRAGARIAEPVARLRDAVEAADVNAPARGFADARDESEEIDALRRAIASLLERLDASLAQARRFAADASHELRTPLTAALGALELLREEADLSDETRAALARSHRSLTELADLMERLLVLSVPLGAVVVSREAVDLGEVAHDLLHTLNEHDARRVHVLATGEVVVRGDPTLLKLMLANALSNALKFAPEGSVTVRLSREGDAVTAWVEDEGPGVAEAERERVFEAFYRGAQERSHTRGHGIGLALLAHIARLHHGTARFESAPRGARLAITLAAWQGLP